MQCDVLYNVRALSGVCSGLYRDKVAGVPHANLKSSCEAEVNE